MPNRITVIACRALTGQAALMATLVLLAAGCVPAVQEGERAISDPVTLIVENAHWQDVAVHLVGRGTPRRLGAVASMRTAEFAVPRAYVLGASDLAISASPIGSNDVYVSPSILVRPGSIVRLQIARTVALSTYAVRDGKPF